MISRTPATRAGMAVISSDEGSGYRPAGHVAAHAIERQHALLDLRRPAPDVASSRAAPAACATVSDIAAAARNRSSHLTRHAREPPRRISARLTSIGPSSPSNRCA